MTEDVDSRDIITLLSRKDIHDILEEIQGNIKARCNTTVTMPVEVAGEFEILAKQLGTTRHKLMVLVLTLGVENLSQSVNGHRFFSRQGLIDNGEED